MYAEERRERIVEVARSDGRVGVARLGDVLAVMPCGGGEGEQLVGLLTAEGR